jgi:hypothetical protein
VVCNVVVENTRSGFVVAQSMVGEPKCVGGWVRFVDGPVSGASTLDVNEEPGGMGERCSLNLKYRSNVHASCS